MPDDLRVCLLSGGGDAPGVNAVLRAFVHSAQCLEFEVLGCRRGFAGMLEPEAMTPLSIADVRGALPKGGSFLGCSTKLNPFFFRNADGSISDVSGSVVAGFRARGVDAVVFVGGDGTTLGAQRFDALGLPAVCIPKTIDNDLSGTDTTVGFDTAVGTATHAIDNLHSTAEAHSRVMILELMGRNAGFIALTAGVAGGADVILLPELPYRLDRVIAKIRERDSRGLSFTIIVIAEGARPLGGEQSEIEGARPGHLPRLGGVGERLQIQLEAAGLEHEVRVTVLGHLQRGGAPTPADRNLGTLLGSFAAELCKRREFHQRLVVRAGRVEAIPLEATAHHKQVDLGGQLVRAATLMGVEFGDTFGTLPSGP